MRHVVPRSLKSTWRKRSDTGFALVLVLWILGALSVLATVYASYVAATAAETTDYVEPLKAEAMAQAALELSAWRELATPPQQRAGQGSFAFRLDDAVVTVTYSCENSRIDLNAAAEDLLAGLLVSFGRSPATAKGYARRIVEWRTKIAGPANTKNSASSQPAAQTFGFQHVAELANIPDLPAQVVKQITPYVTVYSADPKVNALTATPQIIAALPGVTRERLDAFLAARADASRKNQPIPLDALGPAQDFVTRSVGSTLRVDVRIQFANGHRKSVEAVIKLFSQGSEPFSVLTWLDDSFDTELRS
jgi:general secretion pathway protein K